MVAELKQHFDDIDHRARLMEIVREELKRADGMAVDAAPRIADIVRGDAALFRVVADPLIDAACYEMAAQQVRQTRKVVWTPPRTVSADDQRARVVRLSDSNLLNFPLPGGLRLGAASRDELREAAGFYARQASDMAWKSRWLDLVQKRVPKTKCVADVLTDADLRDLQEKANA